MDLDFDEMLRYSVVWFIKEQPYIKKNFKWALKYFTLYGIYTFGFLCLIYTVKDTDLRNGDMADACYILNLIFTYFVSSIKRFILFKYQDLFVSMMDFMKKDYEVAKTLPPKEQAIVLRSAKNVRKVDKFWSVLFFTSVFITVGQPLVFMLYYSLFEEFRYEHIVEFSVPASLEQYKGTFLYFITCFVISIYFILYSSVTIVAMSLLGIIFMIHAAGQLELLTMRALQLYPKDGNVPNEEREKNLKHIAKRLQELYVFVDDIKSSHKMLHELTLKATSLSIPVLLYIILGIYGQMHLRFGPTIGLLFACFILAAFPCYFGDLLISKSEELSYALYNCGWERYWEKRVRSTLLVIMTRASRTVAIRTVFRVINLETFTDIMRLAYTIFNLINTVME